MSYQNSVALDQLTRVNQKLSKKKNFVKSRFDIENVESSPEAVESE